MRIFKILIIFVLVTLLVACDQYYDVVPVKDDVAIFEFGPEEDRSIVELRRGEYFEIEVPVLLGYRFLGLYDDEDVQYVNSSGKSVKVWDGVPSRLIGKWEARTYTIIFELEGGTLHSGASNLSITYGATLPTLSIDVRKIGHYFVGWYTEANGQGVKLSNQTTWLGHVTIFDSEYFPISSTSTTLQLYAYYEV